MLSDQNNRYTANWCESTPLRRRGGDKTHHLTFKDVGKKTGVQSYKVIPESPLGWAIPYCDTCVQHSRKNISPELPIFVAMVLFWLGLGSCRNLSH